MTWSALLRRSAEDIGGAQVRSQRHQQRRRARDVRRGDRGARLAGVRAPPSARPRPCSARPRPARPAPRTAAAARTRPADPGRRSRATASTPSKRGRVIDRVVAVAGVAGGGHDQRTLVLGVLDGGLEGGRVARARRADVDDLRAVVGGVQDRLDHRAVRTTTQRVERFDRQQLDFPADPGDAVAVVADGADDARDGRTVRLVVLGPTGVRQKVVAQLEQQVRAQVRMGQVDARVQDGDDHVLGARPQVPRLLHADAPQVPLEGAIERVVRGHLGDLFAFGLGGADQVGPRLQQRAHLRPRPRQAVPRRAGPRVA